MNSEKLRSRFRKKTVQKGGRNLIMLGVLSTLIALLTTGVSLAIYHNSGDIYLDRSRPGFLPDEEEVKKENDGDDKEEYDFSDESKVTNATLDVFMEELNQEIKMIDSYEDSFKSETLSDQHFGIEEIEKNP